MVPWPLIKPPLIWMCTHFCDTDHPMLRAAKLKVFSLQKKYYFEVMNFENLSFYFQNQRKNGFEKKPDFLLHLYPQVVTVARSIFPLLFLQYLANAIYVLGISIFCSRVVWKINLNSKALCYVLKASHHGRRGALLPCEKWVNMGGTRELG